VNRELILINSALDSHAEWLGDQLAREQYSQLFVEHISVKKIVRSLGGTALKSIDSALLYDAVSDALTIHDSAGLVLVSNYPQHSIPIHEVKEQIDDIYELAGFDDRTIAGLIIPDSPKTDSVLQILSENRVPLTVPDAEKILLQHQQGFDPMVIEFLYRGLPTRFVDMSNEDEEVIYDAVQCVMQLIRPGGPVDNRTS